MRAKLVVVPSIAEPITRSPGFAKKGIAGHVEPLAHWKLGV